MKDNTLRILQDGLENIVSMHCATLSPKSRSHYNNKPADGKKDSSEEESRLAEESHEHDGEDDSAYDGDRIV